MSLKLFLGAESLTPKASGIGRVARLMARVLNEPFWQERVSVYAQTLNEPAAANEFQFPVQSAAGSRAKFLQRTYLKCVFHRLAIYDHLGIARAHPFLVKSRPFLSYIHGTEVWETSPKKRIQWARRANWLISNSEYTKNRAQDCHGVFSRAKVCWLATEEDDFPNREYHNGPPTVLIAGRIDWPCYKGHTELLQVWPTIVAAVPDARLLIVGGGAGLERLRAAAAQTSCARNIDIRGFVSNEILSRMWAEANIFAMPSRGEGFGIVYIEAMRQGLPVIASVHDAAPEVNIDGVTGYNVTLGGNNAELADRLIHLLRNPEEAQRLGIAGRSRWSNHFRYSAFRERFTTILQGVLRDAA